MKGQVVYQQKESIMDKIKKKGGLVSLTAIILGVLSVVFPRYATLFLGMFLVIYGLSNFLD